jgi:hypothetical protein
MNTRLQVEHPVTEAIFGVDLVREQIRVASGLPMSFTQDDLEINGHAIEVRINAERCRTLPPAPARYACFTRRAVLGVRMDSALYGGYSIPPYYDSLIGKLIVHGRDRPEALARLQAGPGRIDRGWCRYHRAAVPRAAGRTGHPERGIQHSLAGKMAGKAVWQSCLDGCMTPSGRRAAPRFLAEPHMRPTPHPQITPEILLRAYAMGIFPMAESRDDPTMHWIDPRRRGHHPAGGVSHLAQLAPAIGAAGIRCGRTMICRRCRRLRRPAGNLDQRRSRGFTNELHARALPIRWRSGKGAR